MKKHLHGLVFASFLTCLLLLSMSIVTGQASGSPGIDARSAISDSVSHILAERIKIYPIPVKTDLIADNIEGVTMIEVFDITGNKCVQQVCDNHYQVAISVSELKRGVYFIRFKTPRATLMKRFIKD